MAGYPVALFIKRASRRWHGFLLAIVIFPFLISAVVRAFGWTVILGRSGLINKGMIWFGIIEKPIALVQNEIGIIIGETHLLLPYMILSLLAVIQRIDPNIEDAAKSLGASPIDVFWRVVVPMTLPGLLTGTLLYQNAFGLYDWTKAATIGVVLLVLGIFFVTMHRILSRRSLRSYG
jgi:putative spermidine/putrescine transport system permease protein